MKIGILGAGVYAIALADIITSNNHKVTLWTKFEDEMDYLTKNRKNKNLENYIIPTEVNFTTNLKEVMNNDLIIFAVPGDFIAETALSIKTLVNNQHFCIASKGVYNDKTLFEVVKEIIDTNNIGVISGPTFAIDIIKKVPIGFSLATINSNTKEVIIKALKNNRVAIDLKNDIIGISICGSLKNIIAIGNGMLSGLDLPISTQSLLITKAIYEIQTIINYYNGNEDTIVSLAGIGDLILTCTSEKSRNYTLGYMFGNKKQDEIDDYIKNTTIEGIAALNQIQDLILSKKINIPIISCIYNIIYNKEKIDSLLEIIAK